MQLRIATWNLFFGNHLSDAMDAVRDHPDFADIDIIALQEASIHQKKEDSQYLAETLGKHYNYWQITAQKYVDSLQANAIIWNTKRITVTHKEWFFLPTFRDVIVGRVERTIKTLLPSGRRNCVMIEGVAGNKTFRVYSAHFDVLGFAHKQAQLQYILQDNSRRRKKAIVCIAGDLNTFKILRRPRWRSLQELAAQYAFNDITTNIKWTFEHREFHYHQKLDAIFLHAEQLKFSSWSSNVSGSDHIPVFAILDL